MDDTERALAEWTEADGCLIFGRASTALYALFRVLAADRPDGEVLIPELTCEVVPVAAHLAGLRPVLVDIEPHCLRPSVDEVRARLGPSTVALVVVYPFGMPFDIGPFVDLQAEHDFVLIEDVAQAVGGSCEQRRLGTTGDATLLSFDHRKILRGSGGALAIREPELAGRVAIERDQIDARRRAPRLAEMMSSFRDLTRALVDLSRCDRTADVSRALVPLLPRYEPVVVLPRSGEEGVGIVDQLGHLDDERERRYDRYLKYRHGLDGTGWEVLDLPTGSMCWRAPIVAPDSAAAASAAARVLASGRPASNLYAAFGTLYTGAPRPVADRYGRHLLNLWVDDVVDDDDVARTIEIVVGE